MATMNTAKLLNENYDLDKGIILEETKHYSIRTDKTTIEKAASKRY